MIDTTFVTIVVGSFVAAVVNAAFSAGGALIILAITTTVLPVQAIVPIHSLLLIGSTTTRTYAFREFIDSLAPASVARIDSLVAKDG